MLDSRLSLNGPLYVGYDITNKCNLNCIHCFNESGSFPKDLDMIDKDVINLMNEIMNISPMAFCFCGGEPLIRYKLLIESIKILKKQRISVSLVSNGTLTNLKNLKALKEYGLDSIQFSLDGANAYTHDIIRNSQGVYNKVIQSIKDALDMGLNVSIAFTCTSININEFIDFCNLIDHINSKHKTSNQLSIRVSPLISLGRVENNNDLVPNWNDYRKIKIEIDRRNHELNGVNYSWIDPYQTYGAYSSINQMSAQLHIRANGDVGYNPYIKDVVGNVKEHSLRDIWAKRNKYIEEHLSSIPTILQSK